MLKNKNKIALILVMLISLIISEGIIAAGYNDYLPEEVSRIIRNEKETYYHEDVDTVKSQFEKFLYRFDNFNEEIDEDLIKIDRNAEKPFLLSTEKAISDVDFLFKLLKYGYAGYQYFGGDEGFNSAKSNIKDEIKRKSIFSRLTTAAFAEILIDNLDFIQDGHFAVDGKGVFERYSYFTSPRFDFRQDKRGYYTWLEGEKAYLISVDNEDYDDYLKLSINKDGEIVYRLGKVSSQENANIKVYIQLKPISSEKIKDVHLVLIRQDKGYSGRKTPYNLYRREGIPIIEHRTANANSTNRDKLEKLAAEAVKFKDEEYVIIDLRGNSGGSDIYASDWVENFTGTRPGEGLIVSNLVTGTANKMLTNSLKTMYDLELSELEQEYQQLFERTESGWSEINYYENKIIDNDTLIIVLMGSGVASAGESFVEYLKQLSNVLFIGTNTRGLVNFGNMGMCNLPDSSLEIYFSKTISLPLDLKLREGRGYFPDFWVNTEDALDLSLKFINSYFK